MKSLAWEPLGNVSASRLTEARLQLHHAADLVASVGRCLGLPRPYDGHTSLEWHAEARALVGQEVPGPRPWRAALRPEELSVAVRAESDELGRLALSGRTRLESFAWLVERARDLGAPVERLSLAAPYRLPEHAVGAGAKFAPPGDGSLAELAHWFADADALLRDLAESWPGSTPVRVWPHHFDIGSVLPLGDVQGEESPSIGVGLSPGDEGIEEPYFYVTPWPPPAVESLPDLPAGGRWHRKGWIGAVLTGSEVVAAGAGSAQASAASTFISRTVDALQPSDRAQRNFENTCG